MSINPLDSVRSLFQAQARPPSSEDSGQGAFESILRGLRGESRPQAASAQDDPSSVRQEIDRSSLRGEINLAARHPEAQGLEPGLDSPALAMASPAQSGECQFSKQDEELFLTAAAAQAKLMAQLQARSRQTRRPLRDVPQLRDDSGTLCSRFESGNQASAIGYDSKGGTSYGLFQLTSGGGAMDRFIKFLDSRAPDIANRLRAAGPANTGGKDGAMPAAWKSVAEEAPARFNALQREFIKQSHYQPALQSISQNTGVNLAERSPALREVLWSTAVQHGPNKAADIFTQAIEKVKTSSPNELDKALIEEVYNLRQNHFEKNGGRARGAVKTRLKNEKDSAIVLLEGRDIT